MNQNRISTLAAIVASSLLTGCGFSTLAGDWTGEMDFSQYYGWVELDVTLSLEDVGDGEFTGHFEADGTATEYGDSYPVRMEADLELELTDDAGGDQPITSRWSNCETWADADYMEGDCPFAGNWHWDGEDELVYTDDTDWEMILYR